MKKSSAKPPSPPSGTPSTTGRLTLEKQLFFNVRSFFESFDQFDQRMIQVTHTSHQLAPALYRRVKEKFESYLTPEGANFPQPAAGGFVKEGGVRVISDVFRG